MKRTKEQSKTRERLIYAGLFAALFLAEVLIGLFVDDAFYRPYFGDVLVVILLWALIRIILPRGVLWLSGAIFLFAMAVEFSQMIPLCDLLGIRNPLIRTLMGTSYSNFDILAYAAGCLVTFGADLTLFLRRKHKPV